MQYKDIGRADTLAKQIFSDLKKKHPRLDAYLVYSTDRALGRRVLAFRPQKLSMNFR